MIELTLAPRPNSVTHTQILAGLGSGIISMSLPVRGIRLQGDSGVVHIQAAFIAAKSLMSVRKILHCQASVIGLLVDADEGNLEHIGEITPGGAKDGLKQFQGCTLL